MRKFIILIIGFIVGCTPKNIDLDSLCKDIHNSYECAQKIEKYQLTQYDDLVKRVNNKLILKTDKKSNIIFEDIAEEANGVWFSFRDYIEEINSYIVHIHYYEGEAYYLINKHSGDKVQIPGLVIVSPSKLRIVSYSMDIEAGYSTNGFVIYKLTDSSFIEEFETELIDWGPSKAKWINDKQIEFEKSAWTGANVSVVGKVVYEFNDNWKIKK